MKTVGEYTNDSHDSLEAADEHWEEWTSGDEVTQLQAIDYHLRYAQVEATLAVAAALVNLTRAKT